VKYEVIAVDFDGTIVQEQWPNIGPLIHECVEVLQKYSKRGGKIILWTCREDRALRDAVKFCIDNQIPIDYVNMNPPERTERFGIDSRKIGADLYIDDKTPIGVYRLLNGLPAVSWTEIDMIINEEI
jgi:hypothetical protein